MRSQLNGDWFSMPVSSKAELNAFWILFILVLLSNFFVDSINGPFPPVPILYLTTFGVAIWFWQHRWLRLLALSIAIVQSVGRVASIWLLDPHMDLTAFSVFVAVLRANFLSVFVFFVFQQRSLTDQLKLSLRRLAEAQETERRTIASALHDEVGQTVSVIMMNVGQLQGRVDGAGTKILESTSELCKEAMQQLRNMANGLCPIVLYDLGLAAAARSLVTSLEAHTSFDFNFTENIGARRVDKNVEIVCFRAIQEALSNAIRHSNATQVNLDISADDRGLACSVQDDGRGFNVGEAFASKDGHTGFGLANLKHAVYGFGGKLSVESRINEGTCVSIQFPLDMTVRDRAQNESEPNHSRR